MSAHHWQNTPGKESVHLDVHQDDVKVTILLELADGDAAMLCDNDLVAVLLEALRDNHAVDHLEESLCCQRTITLPLGTICSPRPRLQGLA